MPPEPAAPEYDHRCRRPRAARQRLPGDGAPTPSPSWVREQRPLLLTDTTFRDAHQSLLATRVRTRDMLRVADAYARLCPGMFSLEMWGGATFDTSHAVPQGMPLAPPGPAARADPEYPVPDAPARLERRRLHELSRQRRQGVRPRGGIGRDRPVPHLRLAQLGAEHGAWRSRRSARPGRSARRPICYTGDILNPARPKYDLQYYVDLAKELERLGAHILSRSRTWPASASRTAAERLIKALRAGSRRPDPLPHPRHRRRPGRQRPAGRRSWPRHRRRRRAPRCPA